MNRKRSPLEFHCTLVPYPAFHCCLLLASFALSACDSSSSTTVPDLLPSDQSDADADFSLDLDAIDTLDDTSDGDIDSDANELDTEQPDQDCVSSYCEEQTLHQCEEDGSETLVTCEYGCDSDGEDAFCRCAAAADCAEGEFCSLNGRCLPSICDPETQSCDGNTAVLCNEDGSQNHFIECAFACSEGTCVCESDEHCTPTEYCDAGLCVADQCPATELFCAGNTLLQCDERGAASTPVEECGERGCLNAACGCSDDTDCPQAMFCLPGAGPNGESTCVDDLCEAGAQYCDADTLMQCDERGAQANQAQACHDTCVQSEGGAWCQCSSDAQCDSAQHCSQGHCVGNVCEPNAMSCDGNVAVVCNPEGSAVARIDCGAAVCADGVCLCSSDSHCPSNQFCDLANGNCLDDLCVQGAEFCSGRDRRQCNPNGTADTLLETCRIGCVADGGLSACRCNASTDCELEQHCAPDAFVSLDVCLPDVCVAGEMRCTGNIARVCNADGSFESATDCGSRVCQDGLCLCTDDSQCPPEEHCNLTCQADLCAAEQRFCVGDSVYVCDDRGVMQELAQECQPGHCLDGDCQCGSNADCLSGEYCSSGVCAEIQCPGGTLCGNPASCCPAGNECIGGACLPNCASGVRCGAGLATCCGSSEVCIADFCAAPGVTCADSYDCVQPGEFCEPTLSQCLPQPNPVTCTVVPSFSDLRATVEWSNLTDMSIAAPFVADVDGDGTQDVVVNATQGPSSWDTGTIVILNGKTGAQQVRVSHNPPTSYGSQGRSTHALGDVNGDGLPDIVYAGRTNTPVVAVDGNGTLLWRSHNSSGTAVNFNVYNGAVTLANFDDDPMAEAVLGASLIDHDGLVLWNYGNDGPYYGTNGSYRGGISAVADLDGDGKPEIVSGRHAWKVSWTSGSPPTVNVSNFWTYGGTTNDGYPAIADLDGDGKPEVILVARGYVIAINGQTGQRWCGIDPSDAACVANSALRTAPVAIPGGGIGGPPTIADFDGDGRVEVGVAGAASYSVYDFNRPGESLPTGLSPASGAIFVRWSRTTQDQSSNATGSSVFDFQGDGVSEVVYADECFMRVYNGADGQVELEIPNVSGTIHEYPIVVDVDSDGNSEIMIVANGTLSTCPTSTYPGYSGPIRGVFVYGDVDDVWVPTRRVWTQHTYHVTNATSDGNVPLLEEDNWTKAGLNNYRQNVQGEGVFNAPDLDVDISVGQLDCATGQLELRARVSNLGALGVAAGVEVQFFEGNDASGTLLGTAITSIPLLPGGSTIVSLLVPGSSTPHDYYVQVDGSGASAVVECDESNNDAGISEVRCLQ
ncbi:MAG: VCBS repeat-containing protein [Myxococcota bacterium]|jgi:hypothetical protein|nr:VCBS repeat-containing protein [Myxococcota bacterium]